MKTELKFSKISKEQIKILTTIVSESLAIDIVPIKRFTSTDLWNIRRRSITMRNKRSLALMGRL